MRFRVLRLRFVLCPAVTPNRARLVETFLMNIP